MFLHVDCSQVFSQTLGFCIIIIILISLLPFTIVLFVAVLEKQKLFVPHLLLQKIK